MDRKIRVLVITYLPWRNDVSVGNSYSNIFKGMNDRIEFAHIYFRDDDPDNVLCHRYFHISEKELAKSILTRKPVGNAFYLENPRTEKKIKFSSKYNIARRLRWQIFLLAREMTGRLGVWKSKQLDLFVEKFKPDLIFGTLTYEAVVNQVMIYLKRKFEIPLVTYPWDDYYSTKRKSYSPVFWIRFFLYRPWMKACAQESEFLYTITEMMKNEYSICFNKECRPLYKGYDFKDENRIEYSRKKTTPIKMLYTGYIGGGRWTVLAELAANIERINREKPNSFFLDIYTLSPINEKMREKLNMKGSSMIKGAVSAEKVLELQRESDVLIHVEPVDMYGRLQNRLSFSTKIVDYFYSSRCILALGGFTASMDYLKKQDAAIVEENLRNIISVLKKMQENPGMIKEYSEKSWNCGLKNHNIKKIQDSVYEDFLKLEEETHNKHDYV
jgi:hypothetical protein